MPPLRPRGAPTGNRNALKHGFYARQYRKADLRDIESCQFTGLNDEIALLRVYIRRVMELSPTVDQLPDAIQTLHTLCLATTCLNRLLKTQVYLSIHDPSAGDDLQKAFLAAIEQMVPPEDSDVDRPALCPSPGGREGRAAPSLPPR